MITMPSWLFLSSFENIRKYMISNLKIESLLHMGRGIFGIDFGSVAFTLKKEIPDEKKTNYYRLHKRNFQHIYYNDIEKIFLNSKENFNYKYNFDLYRDDEGVNVIPNFSINNGQQIRFQAKQKDFEKIPGSPIAYWVSDKVREIFEKNQKLGDIGEIISGMTIGKNDLYLRKWFEVNNSKVNLRKLKIDEINLEKNPWIPYSKGGEIRRWFGNNEWLVNWSHSNKFNRAKTTLKHLYLKEALVWNFISSSNFSMKYLENGFLWDIAGSPCFFKKELLNYVLGFLLTKFSQNILNIMNPTINYQAIDIENMPFLYNENKANVIDNLVQQNISISKEEWDSRETSWDFEKLSLIDGKDLKTAYENYCNHWRDNFVQLHKNEEELNRLFIEIYDLQDEMDEKVAFDDITILKKEAKIVELDNSISKEFSTESEKYLYDRGVSLEFNKDELVKQFLSYAIGCIMGRYSTNKSGLIMANSDDILELSENKFIVKRTDGEIRQEVESKFLPDEFGIIPITDEKDFSNDIVEKVKEFIKYVYGEENLKDNLNFIAEALGNKDNKAAEEIIRTYFIKDLDTLLKELREYANEVKHIAEQKIPLDLDDGVNVNYEKLGVILKKR